MKLYYCTRYEHSPDQDTEYYTDQGWRSLASSPNDKISLCLFTKERDAVDLLDNVTDGDWHAIQLAD